MPTYHFDCEICGRSAKAWRAEDETPPRYCGRKCTNVWRAGRAFKRPRYPITPEIHEQIRQVYQERLTGNGQLAALAEKLGIPRTKIGRYAVCQGWVAKQRREPDWSDEEIRVLETCARLSPERIQIKLKRAGFRRSIQGIVLKRKRSNFLAQLEGYSAHNLARCLGVDAHFVTRAIKAGLLKATHRGTARMPQQGGDMYWMKERDIREWIVENINEIDIRKVDKHWFVDLLANGRAA